jgi:hypothetical protein
MIWTKIYQTFVDFVAYRNYEFYDNVFHFNEYEISYIYSCIYIYIYIYIYLLFDCNWVLARWQ